MKYLLIVFVVASCATQPSERDIVEQKVRVYLAANYFKDSATIDSLQLIRYDTLTDKHRLLHEKSLVMDVAEAGIEIMKAQNSLIKTQMNLAKLWKHLSPALAKTKQADAENSLKEVRKTTEETKIYLEQADSLEHLISVCDSITPLGLKAVFFYQIRRFDQSIDRDTLTVQLTMDKEILVKDNR